MRGQVLNKPEFLLSLSRWFFLISRTPLHVNASGIETHSQIYKFNIHAERMYVCDRAGWMIHYPAFVKTAPSFTLGKQPFGCLRSF